MSDQEERKVLNVEKARAILGRRDATPDAAPVDGADPALTVTSEGEDNGGQLDGSVDVAATATATAPDEPKPLSKMNRGELNALAAELEIEGADTLPNMAAVIEAIEAKRAGQ